MTYEQALDLMDSVWDEYGLPKDLSRRKCFSCNRRLKVEGKETIIFPLNYEGNCPLCENPLQETRCPGWRVNVLF